jgi:ubiquinone/menaquinone biosynthesis C-methylase UbiE
MNLRQIVVGQFKQPHGRLGQFAGWIMTNRRSNRDRNDWTVKLLDIQSTDRVLEIGCGPGVALAACLERTIDGHVIGLDHSQTMLDQARSRNPEAIRERRLELHLGSLEVLPATLGSFDKVYSVNVVQFFADRAAAFHKMYSVLTPNGVAATTYLPRGKNPSKADAHNMAKDVDRLMADIGFQNIRIEELPMAPVPAVCIIGERP